MKTNYQILKDNYKLSTIPRMKEQFGYRTIRDINKCKHLTAILFFEDMIPLTQDELFREIQESIDDEKLTPYEFMLKERERR